MRLRSLMFAVFLVSAAAGKARASGCPATPVAEEGGSHWCYSAGARGNVHLWTPAGYDPATAVTIVYVHGHDIDASPRGQAHYLDGAWSAHRLAAQFAASGIGALFVAVEGPLNDRQKVKWDSLDALLRSIRADGGVKPPGRVVAVAHSAGIFTVKRFLGDARLAHVIVLDAAYQDAPKRLASWYRGSKDRRLTLVGAQSVGWKTARLVRALGCRKELDENAARCASLIDTGLGHMAVVTAGGILPLTLARIRR